MHRALTLLLPLLVASGSAVAGVVFVQPLDGAQLFGPQTLEITSDAVHVDRVDFFVDGVLAGIARKPPYRVVHDFGTSLASRKVAARVWMNGFKSSESATVVSAAVSANETLDVDLVEVPLRVRSSRAFKRSDLRVRENGVLQNVRDVRLERPPAHFAFVVDRSLSMGGGKLEAALRAIESELRQLRPGDTSSLVLFNHHVSRPQPVRGTASFPSGGTSLRDALASVATTQRTHAIVITDGGDRNSALSEEAALRKISGTKTVVNAVVLGHSHAGFLDRAAENTGGTVVSTSKENVTRELRRVLEDINSRYLLVYQSRGTRRGWRTIDVQSSRVEVAGVRKGYFAE